MTFARILLTLVMTSLPVCGVTAQLLVLNKNDNTLSFVDPATGKTNATIPTGEGPHEVELAADGRLAFVSNYGAEAPGNSLSVIDVPARKELKRVDLVQLRRPHGLVYRGRYLYFTAEVNRSIARFDPVAQRVDWTFETGQEGTHMVLASGDGNKLFTTNIGSNTVSIIERGSGDRWMQKIVSVGAGPEGLDLSPDGRTLWTAHSRDGGISAIDTATGTVTHTFNAGTRRSNRLKVTPDGRSLLVSDLSAGELVIFDASRGAERARVKLGRAPTGILVVPGGKQAYVAVSGDNRVALVDLQTFAVVRTIATGNGPDGMAWVP